MLCRVCYCDKNSLTSIKYGGEECLIAYYKDEIIIRKSFYPLPFRFFADYSFRNDTVVLLFAGVVLDKTLSGFFIFDKGAIACVAESIAEGAKRRKVYKGIGLCVGEDYKSPFTCELLRGNAKMIVCAAKKRFEKEDYGLFLAYRSFFSLPVLFLFSECVYAVDKRIKELKENEIVKIDSGLSVRNLKSGQDTVVVIDR